jgi:predicted ATPase/class 3 adenylate cyclase
MESLPTGTVTFLFTDIEGSTRLLQETGSETYRAALEQHQRLLRRAFADHEGLERGTQGDSFLVVFREAGKAIAAAVDAQRALAAADWPSGAAIRVRMGLHSGVGELGGDDYVGLDIHRAARIASVAHGGQVLLSEATKSLGDRQLPPAVTTRNLGRHRLKDLAQPEQLFQLVVEGLPSDFPPLRTLSARLNNLPIRLTSFLGRERETKSVADALAGNRLVSLTGPGGAGKTSLAQAVAAESLASFRDGAWFVSLDVVNDPSLVASALTAVVPLGEPGRRGPEDRLVQDLAEREMLVLLDNFEQVMPAASLVARLLRACPGLKFLITSRGALRITGEWEFAVPPLDVNGAERTGGGSAPSDSAAVQLFIERARAVRSDFQVREDDRRIIAAICARLDGLPLGIELAAARVNLLTPASILDRLERRLPLPGRPIRDLPERQQTLDAAIAWSYDLLDEPERRLFARLSIFAGGCRIDEAETVCGPGEEIGRDVVDGLADLIDHSLIRRVESGADSRFAMFETIRGFARTRLAEADDEVRVAARHLGAYLALAEHAAPLLVTSQQARWSRLVGLELDNIRSALRYAIEHGGSPDGLRLGAAMWRYWQQEGYLVEGDRLLTALLDAATEAPDSIERAQALLARGSLRYWLGSISDADSDYAEAIRIARAVGERHVLATALFDRAFTLVNARAGDADSGIAEAIALAEELGDPESRAHAAWLRVWIAQQNGDPRELRERALEALELFRSIDDVVYSSMCLGTLSYTVLRMPNPRPVDLREALDWGFDSLRLYRAIREVGSTTITLIGTASLMSALGEHAGAVRTRSAADAVAKRYDVQPPPQFLRQLPEDPRDLARRAGISSLDVERLEAEGRAMSLPEAVEYAIGLEPQLKLLLERPGAGTGGLAGTAGVAGTAGIAGRRVVERNGGDDG